MILGSLITVAWDTGGAIFTDGSGRLWKRPDGSLLAVADYPDLYAVIGDRYGSTGPTDFRLPNFTARMVRGWDPTSTIDIDSASRTIPGPGATSSDAGTVQPEIVRTHAHYAFPQGRFFRSDQPGDYQSPGAQQLHGSGPNYPSPSTTTTISGNSNNYAHFSSNEFKPYHMVVDFLIRIK